MITGHLSQVTESIIIVVIIIVIIIIIIIIIDRTGFTSGKWLKVVKISTRQQSMRAY